jgi:hypothetical protein
MSRCYFFSVVSPKYRKLVRYSEEDIIFLGARKSNSSEDGTLDSMKIAVCFFFEQNSSSNPS